MINITSIALSKQTLSFDLYLNISQALSPLSSLTTKQYICHTSTLYIRFEIKLLTESAHPRTIDVSKFFNCQTLKQQLLHYWIRRLIFTNQLWHVSGIRPEILRSFLFFSTNLMGRIYQGNDSAGMQICPQFHPFQHLKNVTVWEKRNEIDSPA